MANVASDKLLKILRLEAQLGCQDKAVTRGLASFAAAWLADASRNGIESELAETVLIGIGWKLFGKAALPLSKSGPVPSGYSP